MALKKATGIKGFFARLFSASDEEKNNQLAKEAVDRIVRSLETLSQKAGTLNDSFAEQKSLIASMINDASSFIPQNQIAAAKCEQSILSAITATSSACDSVLSGSEGGTDGAEFKKQVAALSVLVTQRSHFTD